MTESDSPIEPLNRAGDERSRLALQRMERALVRAWLAASDQLPDADYQTLRYAIGLARLHEFAPANQPDAADVRIDPQTVLPLRDWLLTHLHDLLRSPTSAVEKLTACREAIHHCRGLAITVRRQLLDTHVDAFDAEALDREAGQRALVVVAGGGGGAGYVYSGAFARLDDAGLIPDYIVGNSIGAILGLFRAQRRHGDQREYIEFASTLKKRDIFTPSRRRREFCLGGLLHLHLRALHRRMSVGPLRRPLRLDEMEIPLDIVVAGLRRRPYEKLGADMREPNRGPQRFLPMPLRVAARLTRLLQFFRSDMVEPIVLGRDTTTRAVHAVDAVGFSAAVPTILQYEPGPTAGVTREIFAELMYRHELTAIVDGGVADNVPARAAWRGIAAGRARTRNAYYLAFDCFVPRLDPKNLWLWPIMQTVQMQMRVNRVYADTMVRFHRTLSPMNIVPQADALQMAMGWGYEQMDTQLAEVQEMMRPVRLDGAADVPVRRA
ncbi:MAG: patatin-like phospholipase family protein [Salinisphaera sp.]|jgi:hypothetical protein|nr:patatin-like phospholipase family protein [Salinisphaera sp.]